MIFLQIFFLLCVVWPNIHNIDMFVLHNYIPYSKFEFFSFDLYTIGYSLYNTMPVFLLAAGIILFLGIFAVFYLNTGLNS